jgi:hypothetical protein
MEKAPSIVRAISPVCKAKLAHNRIHTQPSLTNWSRRHVSCWHEATKSCCAAIWSLPMRSRHVRQLNVTGKQPAAMQLNWRERQAFRVPEQGVLITMGPAAGLMSRLSGPAGALILCKASG